MRWKTARNIVAHGVPGKNGSGELTILFNGKPYDMGENFKDFGKVHDKMIELLDELSAKVQDR